MSDFENSNINSLVPLSHPEVRAFIGGSDPDQTARRMVRAGQLPHVRIGKRIRVSLPALRKWAAEKMASSVAGQAGQEQAEACASAQ